MMYQERKLPNEERSPFLLEYETRTRPRAATMSLCRYTVPCSPIRKPTESPPTSPPSLILPPPGRIGSGIFRTSSFLASFDDRLASSAPLSTYVMKEDERFVSEGRAMGNDFTLIEEDATDYDFNTSRSLPIQITPDLVGFDDFAGPSPVSGERLDQADRVEEFGASPVLLSCLRDIARMPRN